MSISQIISQWSYFRCRSWVKLKAAASAEFETDGDEGSRDFFFFFLPRIISVNLSRNVGKREKKNNNSHIWWWGFEECWNPSPSCSSFLPRTLLDFGILYVTVRANFFQFLLLCPWLFFFFRSSSRSPRSWRKSLGWGRKKRPHPNSPPEAVTGSTGGGVAVSCRSGGRSYKHRQARRPSRHQTGTVRASSLSASLSLALPPSLPVIFLSRASGERSFCAVYVTGNPGGWTLRGRMRNSVAFGAQLFGSIFGMNTGRSAVHSGGAELKE